MINASNYHEYVCRTEDDSYLNPHLRLSPVDGNPYQMRLLHSAIGLVTETSEFADDIDKFFFHHESLSKSHLQEELGDQLWYVGVAVDALGISIAELGPVQIRLGQDTSQKRLLRVALRLCIETGEYMDQVKKFIFYGRGINEDELKEKLRRLLGFITAAASELDISVEQLMQENIEKLRKRYPERFTEEDALERKDETYIDYVVEPHGDMFALFAVKESGEKIHEGSYMYEHNALRKSDELKLTLKKDLSDKCVDLNQKSSVPSRNTVQHLERPLRYKHVCNHTMKWWLFTEEQDMPEPPSSLQFEQEHAQWRLDRILNVKAPEGLEDGIYYVRSATSGFDRRVKGIKIVNGEFQVQDCLDTILKLQVKHFDGELPQNHVWIEELTWHPDEEIFKVSIGS